MAIFPLAPDQTIAQMWSNGARGGFFLQVKRPNQQYQSTEGRSTKDKENNIQIYVDNNAHTKRYTQNNTASPLVYNYNYNNMV